MIFLTGYLSACITTVNLFSEYNEFPHLPWSLYCLSNTKNIALYAIDRQKRHSLFIRGVVYSLFYAALIQFGLTGVTGDIINIEYVLHCNTS